MLKLVGESKVSNMYLYSFKVFPPKTLNYKEKKSNLTVETPLAIKWSEFTPPMRA